MSEKFKVVFVNRMQKETDLGEFDNNYIAAYHLAANDLPHCMHRLKNMDTLVIQRQNGRFVVFTPWAD